MLATYRGVDRLLGASDARFSLLRIPYLLALASCVLAAAAVISVGLVTDASIFGGGAAQRLVDVREEPGAAGAGRLSQRASVDLTSGGPPPFIDLRQDVE